MRTAYQQRREMGMLLGPVRLGENFVKLQSDENEHAIRTENNIISQTGPA